MAAQATDAISIRTPDCSGSTAGSPSDTTTGTAPFTTRSLTYSSLTAGTSYVVCYTVGSTTFAVGSSFTAASATSVTGQPARILVGGSMTITVAGTGLGSGDQVSLRIGSDCTSTNSAASGSLDGSGQTTLAISGTNSGGAVFCYHGSATPTAANGVQIGSATTSVVYLNGFGTAPAARVLDGGSVSFTLGGGGFASGDFVYLYTGSDCGSGTLRETGTVTASSGAGSISSIDTQSSPMIYCFQLSGPTGSLVRVGSTTTLDAVGGGAGFAPTRLSQGQSVSMTINRGSANDEIRIGSDCASSSGFTTGSSYSGNIFTGSTSGSTLASGTTVACYRLGPSGSGNGVQITSGLTPVLPTGITPSRFVQGTFSVTITGTGLGGESDSYVVTSGGSCPGSGASALDSSNRFNWPNTGNTRVCFGANGNAPYVSVAVASLVTVTSISPSRSFTGSGISITLTGTNFGSGDKAVIASSCPSTGTGGSGVTINSAVSATASVTLSSTGTTSLCYWTADGSPTTGQSVTVLASPEITTPSDKRLGAGASQSATITATSGPAWSPGSDRVGFGTSDCSSPGSFSTAPSFTVPSTNVICAQAGSAGAYRQINPTYVTASSPSSSVSAYSAATTLTLGTNANGDASKDSISFRLVSDGNCLTSPPSSAFTGSSGQWMTTNPSVGGTYRICYYVNDRDGPIEAGQLVVAQATSFDPSSVAISQATVVTVSGFGLTTSDRVRVLGPAASPTCSTTPVLLNTNTLGGSGGGSVTFSVTPTALGNYAVCYTVAGGTEALLGTLVGSNVQSFSPQRLASSGSAFTFTVTGGSLLNSDRVQLFSDATGCTTSAGAGPVTASGSSTSTTTFFAYNSGFTSATGALGLCYQAGGTGSYLRIGTVTIPNPASLAPSRFMDGVGIVLTISGTNLDGAADQISLRSGGACTDSEIVGVGGTGSGTSVVFSIPASNSAASNSRAICYRVQTDPSRLDSVNTITIANVTAQAAQASSFALNTSATVSVTGSNINPSANSDQIFLVATGAGCTSAVAAGPFNSSDTSSPVAFSVTSLESGAFDVCYAVRGAPDATKLVPGTPVIVNCTVKADCFLATDACIDSQCGPCTSNDDCDDGDVCNGQEICDTGSGQCQSPQPLNCTTDDACIDGQCVQSAGGCVNTTLCVCGDGYTQLSETCDPGNDTATGAVNVVPGCVDCRRQSGFKCTNNVDPATPAASQCSRTKKKGSSSSFPAAAVAVPIAVVACCCCLILLIIIIAVLIFLCVKFGLFGKATAGAKSAAGKVKMPKMPKRGGGGGGGGGGGAGGVEVEWDDEL